MRATMMISAATAAALLLLQLCSAAFQQPSCPTSCGNVSVPYPFGIGDGCYHSAGFNLTCDRTHQHPRLLLGNGGTPYVVTGISLPDNTVRVKGPGKIEIQYDRPRDCNTVVGNGKWGGLDDHVNGSPYILSARHNQFTLTGCNVQATLLGNTTNIITGCSSFCSMTDTRSGAVTSSPRSASGDTCSGMSCCQTPIPIGRTSYDIEFRWLDPNHEYDSKVHTAVIIAEQGWFDGVSAELLNYSASAPTAVPMVLEWAIASVPLVMPRMDGNSTCPKDAASSACRSRYSSCHDVSNYYRSGYACRCWDGYDGNPYVTDGCQDIDECALPDKCFGSGKCTNTPGGYLCCPRGTRGDPSTPDGCVKPSPGLSVGIGVGSGAGILFMLLGATFVTRKLKHRRAKKLRQRFFKQNRGHLLQQLVSQRADIAERMIIPLKELEKATNKFDKARELGGGGHGTVYKGILSDLHVVAIKKSKEAIQREIDEFINEVAILSQINHRNVVKLFGCCLETEVPLLVYEFISNGTLYHHLHVEGQTSLSWKDRLRIATETSRALAYLHSAVSFPIIHRDIKSHNILLDGALTAKVSDFGASRCIPVDQTGVTTVIQGTLGYLDPMYYYTGRLTEKSDVYSFGVVLIELLTRKKPYSYRSPKDDSLVAHFTALLEEGNLVHILDPQVVHEGGKEIEKAVELAAVCVRLKAEGRPTMREVEMRLEILRASQESVVLRDVGSETSEYNRTTQSSARKEGRNKEETSRQYSLEEEYLLSTRYPR